MLLTLWFLVHADRTSNDADVSSILPKIPYGGFSLSTAPRLAFRWSLPSMLSGGSKPDVIRCTPGAGLNRALSTRRPGAVRESRCDHEMHEAALSSVRSTGTRASLRVQLETKVPGLRQIARIPNLPLAHRIAPPDQPPHPNLESVFRAPYVWRFEETTAGKIRLV
jgi:hypothetical protein